MVPGPEQLTIEKLQEADQSGKAPDTLSTASLMAFLTNNKAVADDLNKNFNLDAGIRLVSGGTTNVEQTISAKFNEVKGILTGYKRLDLMEITTESEMDQSLVTFENGPDKVPHSVIISIKQAWNYLSVIRDHCANLLAKKAKFVEKRGSQGLPGALHEKLSQAREKWDTLSSGQKLMLVGASLVSAVLILNAKEGKMKDVKDALLTGVKVLGGAWVINKVWYLFSGETAYDALTGGNKEKANSEYLRTTFHTDVNGSEALSEAMVKMGDMPFAELVGRYEAAQSTKKIEGVKGMDSGKAYLALDLFFGRYKLTPDLKARYFDKNPPVSLSQVIVSEMTNDKDLKSDERGIMRRTYDTAREWVNTKMSWAKGTTLGVYLTDKYRSVMGRDPTQADLDKMASNFKTVVQSASQFDGILKSDVFAGDAIQSKNFIDTNLKGSVDQKWGVKSITAADGLVYMITDQTLTNIVDKNTGYEGSLRKGLDSLDGFVKEKYPNAKPRETAKSVFIVDESKVRVMMRIQP